MMHDNPLASVTVPDGIYISDAGVGHIRELSEFYGAPGSEGYTRIDRFAYSPRFIDREWKYTPRR